MSRIFTFSVNWAQMFPLFLLRLRKLSCGYALLALICQAALQFPKLLRQDAKVHIIQSRDHILNTYSEKISKYAEARFANNSINTIVNARVKEVGEDYIKYTVKGEDGKPVEHTIPSGFTLWSTGIGRSIFCKRQRSATHTSILLQA